MKHIKKKFLNERPISDEMFKKLKKVEHPYDGNAHKLKVIPKKQTPFIVRGEEERVIQSFTYKRGKKQFFIPEPDQVLIYFDHAYNHYRVIKEEKEKLLAKCNPSDSLTESVENELFKFFGITSACTIFLFMSLEAFVNRLVPTSYKHVIERNDKTEVYDCYQIQRLKFGIKCTDIIPRIVGKDYSKDFSNKYDRLINLKDFRNDLVHAKLIDGQLSYAGISKRALKFDFDNAISAVVDYMNYHVDGYVMDCECGADY